MNSDAALSFDGAIPGKKKQMTSCSWEETEVTTDQVAKQAWTVVCLARSSHGKLLDSYNLFKRLSFPMISTESSSLRDSANNVREATKLIKLFGGNAKFFQLWPLTHPSVRLSFERNAYSAVYNPALKKAALFKQRVLPFAFLRVLCFVGHREHPSQFDLVSIL